MVGELLSFLRAELVVYDWEDSTSPSNSHSSSSSVTDSSSSNTSRVSDGSELVLSLLCIQNSSWGELGLVSNSSDLFSAGNSPNNSDSDNATIKQRL